MNRRGQIRPLESDLTSRASRVVSDPATVSSSGLSSLNDDATHSSYKDNGASSKPKSKSKKAGGRARRVKEEQNYPVEPRTITVIKKPRTVMNHSYRDFSQVPATLDWESPKTIAEMTFSEKVHHILSTPSCELYIRWMPHGRAFKVCIPKLFEELICCKYFGHSRYSSFLRLLNNYGFKHITEGTDRNAYYHECFLRGMPHLCKYMPSPKNARRLIPDPENEPNFYRLSELFPLPDAQGGDDSAAKASHKTEPNDQTHQRSEVDGADTAEDEDDEIEESTRAAAAAYPHSNATTAGISSTAGLPGARPTTTNPSRRNMDEDTTIHHLLMEQHRRTPGPKTTRTLTGALFEKQQNTVPSSVVATAAAAAVAVAQPATSSLLGTALSGPSSALAAAVASTAEPSFLGDTFASAGFSTPANSAFAAAAAAAAAVASPSPAVAATAIELAIRRQQLLTQLQQQQQQHHLLLSANPSAMAALLAQQQQHSRFSHHGQGGDSAGGAAGGSGYGGF